MSEGRGSLPPNFRIFQPHAYAELGGSRPSTTPYNNVLEDKDIKVVKVGTVGKTVSNILAMFSAVKLFLANFNLVLFCCRTVGPREASLKEVHTLKVSSTN